MKLLAMVLLCGGVSIAAADPIDPAKVDYVEDPYAPHVTNGTTARFGSAIGFIYGERQSVLAVGATAAVGQRWGRLTIEAEAAALQLESNDSTDTVLGNGERLGVIARFDVIRLGPHWVGPNSMLALYVEGGADKAWNHWYKPDADSVDSRMVPDDSSRVEGEVGFGLMLEHRLQEPISFPHRIAWFLGWRMAYAPHPAEEASICRGVTCVAAPEMPESSYTDRSMLFQSSLSVTW